MKNLGNILFLLLLMPLALLADFEVKVSSTSITKGDELVVTFVSTDSNQFPNVQQIGGQRVQSTSSEQSTIIVNGDVKGSFKRHHVLVPKESFIIPSYTMKVKGKTYTTKPINIKVTTYKQSDPQGELYYKVFTKQKSVYVGQPFMVYALYKQHRNLDVVDRRLENPSGTSLYMDTKVDEKDMSDATHQIIKLTYVFTPQKSGDLTLKGGAIKVGLRSRTRDAWGFVRQRANYKTLFADDIKLHVKPLPAGVDNIGEFTLDVTVDKHSSDAKQPVNVTLTLRGSGNIQDIEKFKLHVPGALVYDEAPKREVTRNANAIAGKFTQKFAIVADKSYTIPSISFRYLDTKTEEVKILTSDPIEITITGAASTQEEKPLHIERAESTQETPTRVQKEVVYETNYWYVLIALGVGVVIGVLLTKVRFKRSVSKKAPKINARDTKQLLQQLMPYVSRDTEIKTMVDRLQAMLYANGEKVDAKEVKPLLEKIKHYQTV